MTGKLFKLISKGMRPPTNEIEDFLERHGDAIAKAIAPKETKHHCRYPRGKRMWRFSWKWPFIHTWISQAICLCDITAVLDDMISGVTYQPHEDATNARRLREAWLRWSRNMPEGD